MTSDFPLTESTPDVSAAIPLVNCDSQIRLKNDGEKLCLILPTDSPKDTATQWSEICQNLKHRLHSSASTWHSSTQIHLVAHHWLLDGRQLQAIAQTLQEFNLQLHTITTSRRQTAVAAATAGYSIQQNSPSQPLSVENPHSRNPLAEPLYLQTTVRSGAEIRHRGTVIIVGDVNPGGSVIAAGDILIWGSLRGMAHAGAEGDRECRIMALRMEPTQLRIADVVARAPEVPPEQLEPEVAYLTLEGIRLAKATNFAKNHTFSAEIGRWIEFSNNPLPSNR